MFIARKEKQLHPKWRGKKKGMKGGLARRGLLKILLLGLSQVLTMSSQETQAAHSKDKKYVSSSLDLCLLDFFPRIKVLRIVLVRELLLGIYVLHTMIESLIR